jgi:DNA-binding transcriptional LysR family regulator
LSWPGGDVPHLLDARQLREVIAIHDHGSFRQAAKALGISQPALTKSIRKTEQLLAVRLFDRTSKSVIPTDFGRMLAGRGRTILKQLEELEEEVRETSGVERGEICFGVGPFLVQKCLPAVIEQFHERHPGIQMRFVVEPFDRLHEHLLLDEISFYAAETSRAESCHQSRIRIISEEPIVFVVRPDHPLAARKKIGFGELIRHEFASASVPDRVMDWLRARISTAEEEALVKRNIPFLTCEYIDAVRSLAMATDYVTGGPREVFDDQLQQGSLVSLQLDDFNLPIRTGVVWKATRSLSPSAQRLIRMLRTHCAKS